MPGFKRPYAPEFRREAARLVRESGKSMRQVAEDLDVSLESLRKWVRQYEIDTGARGGLSTEEREELQRLRREKRQLMGESMWWLPEQRDEWRATASDPPISQR